jgi:hypothetical protein
MVEDCYKPLRASREGWDQVVHPKLEDVLKKHAAVTPSTEVEPQVQQNLTIYSETFWCYVDTRWVCALGKLQ